MFKKRIAIALLLIIIVFLVCLPYLKAEILTIRHGTETVKLLRNENSWDASVEPQFYRVIEYSHKRIKLYYAAPNNHSAYLCTFICENDVWTQDSEKLIWTRTGNGENRFMWPYYPH